MKSEKRVAFATLDIGTSQIKLGVYCPFLSDHIILIGSLSNSVSYGSAGEVHADYRTIRECSFTLLCALGTFLKKEKVEELHLGICGHVSSLCEWNRSSGTPPSEPFPIWLDTTSYDRLPEFHEVLGDGKSKDIIGTFLPAGTNWLFTKLLHRRTLGPTQGSVFLQVGDAVFFELSGKYKTHFSSQISMVNLKSRSYAPELINHLQLNNNCLPEICDVRFEVKNEMIRKFGLPDLSFVFPAMADLYTSLYGLRLKDKDGFVLANTSEQAGAFYTSPPKVLTRFLSISFEHGFVNYGSTNTGGNVINWFVENILSKKVTSELLEDLSRKAALIGPEDSPIILPYLQGERAPLWNSQLTASILELRSSHSEVHLFRAILESIAYARRQCFEELGMDNLAIIKIGGGSSKNGFWNAIRATVLNKPLAVADEKELSMAGIIDHIICNHEQGYAKPKIAFSIVNPDKELITTYHKKYQRFMGYQRLIHDQASQ
jgi:gluconokinase